MSFDAIDQRDGAFEPDDPPVEAYERTPEVATSSSGDKTGGHCALDSGSCARRA